MRIFNWWNTYSRQPGLGWKPTAVRPRGAVVVARRPIRPLPSDSGRGGRPLPLSARDSLKAARDSVQAEAAKSRAEIEELVEAERAAVVALVADSVKSTEERLRGATENRVDLELSKLRELKEEMREEIAKTVRSEVARTTAEMGSKRRQASPSSRSKGPNRSPAQKNGGKKGAKKGGKSKAAA